MLVDLIQIGNSRGIRLPKFLINQCGIKKTVDIEVVDSNLVLKPVNKARKGWAENILSSSSNNQDNDIKSFESVQNSWDETEWEW